MYGVCDGGDLFYPFSAISHFFRCGAADPKCFDTVYTVLHMDYSFGGFLPGYKSLSMWCAESPYWNMWDWACQVPESHGLYNLMLVLKYERKTR
jgi:hypothetical protein